MLFTLYRKEDVDEYGHIKEGVLGGKPFEKGQTAEGVDENGDEVEMVGGEKGGETVKTETVTTADDDVD